MSLRVLRGVDSTCQCSSSSSSSSSVEVSAEVRGVKVAEAASTFIPGQGIVIHPGKNKPRFPSRHVSCKAKIERGTRPR